jgi:hypothetical protein
MVEKKMVVLGRVISFHYAPRGQRAERHRAGVSGLISALLLSKNPHYKITVAAKHMPSDYDIEYASPWVGAN